MGLKEKFTFVQKSSVFKWTLVAVLALIGALILFYGYKTFLRYAPVKGKGVEVTATASRIEETLDSENMEEYELFVDYEYQVRPIRFIIKPTVLMPRLQRWIPLNW